MLRVRTTTTASLATAVQIVRYEGKKTIIIKHIGSAKNNADLLSLKKIAANFINAYTKQQSLFNLEQDNYPNHILSLKHCEYLGARHTFIYEVIANLFSLFGFNRLKNNMLCDLVLMRIIEPSSKREAIALLQEFFGIVWKETDLYRTIPQFALIKDTVEKTVIAFAKKHYHFNFNLVFYDVTTLYFESFKDDEFKKPGFSKDNKNNQPQIVIGLIVTKEGFPVSYELFAGNTFEGKTFIPTICKFKKNYQVKNLTIVADAAMISLSNVNNLNKHHLSYIVGARTANLTLDQIKQINQALKQVDGATTRLKTERGLLVCDFSLKRYQKDKREMDKQIIKAKRLLLENKSLKRTKFIKYTQKIKPVFNNELMEKAKLLLGIKGYYTNLMKENDETIIRNYHNLWHVEQAFRIAKSDLQMRPIYHFKQQTIAAHILICFMALAICKYMELKTGKSTKKIVKLLKSITAARIRNNLTGEIVIMRQTLSEEVKYLLKILS